MSTRTLQDEKPYPLTNEKISLEGKAVNLSKEPEQDITYSDKDSNRTLTHQDGSLERATTATDGQTGQQPVETLATNNSAAGPVYSVFSTNQKRFIVCMAAWAGFFSTVSANIYFPALNSLAHDLNVSNSLINLTLTSYMIFQGLAPTFIGDLADTLGRRVAYTVCFTIYICANIGLALQNSYAALFVLRCLQSSGSAATIAMAMAVVADVSTPAERGAYMGFTLAGSLVGPALGPVIGGLLSQYLGWRAIFWFLVIFASAFMVIFAIFFPETARNQVGNGSIPPTGWNMSLMNYLAVRKARTTEEKSNGMNMDNESSLQRDPAAKKRKFRFPNPLASLHLIMDRENSLLYFYNAFLFAAFYDITASMPSQFGEIYHLNDLHLGLCYLPFGLGALCASLINGQLLDRNFARWCRKMGVQIRKGRNQDLSNFPVEKARLQIAIPAAYIVSCLVASFGWTMQLPRHPPLAALLVILFCTSFTMTIAFNVTSTLLIDFYPKSPATATAANNLTRCLLGAGATAVVVPMIDGMGRGWTFTFLALFLVATSPMLWIVYYKGMGWRQARWAREEEARKRKESKENGVDDVEANVGVSADAGAVVDGSTDEKIEHRAKDEEKAIRGAHVEQTGQDTSVVTRSGLLRTFSHDSAF